MTDGRVRHRNRSVDVYRSVYRQCRFRSGRVVCRACLCIDWAGRLVAFGPGRRHLNQTKHKANSIDRFLCAHFLPGLRTPMRTREGRSGVCVSKPVRCEIFNASRPKPDRLYCVYASTHTSQFSTSTAPTKCIHCDGGRNSRRSNIDREDRSRLACFRLKGLDSRGVDVIRFERCRTPSCSVPDARRKRKRPNAPI